VRAKTSLEVMALDRETFANLIKSSRATEDEVRRTAAERTRAASPR
jgi:CRP-like cAMP-binding protein